MEYGVEKLKWFAVFLLEGQVFSKLKAFQEYLRSSPRLVIKQWEHGKMVPTVQPLITHKIDSRQKLIDKWASEPTFYLDVVLKWMDPSVHQAVRDAWPPTA